MLGGGSRSLDSYLARLTTLLVHEFTHVIQVGRRLVEGADQGGQLNEFWELEGQANLAEEVLGMQLMGRTTGNDFGAAEAFGGAGFDFHFRHFRRLGSYFGGESFTGLTQRTEGAPGLCTLFGSVFPPLDPPPPCLVASYFYGVAWSLQRFISDRYAASYPGGEAGLQRDWLGKNPTLTGPANVSALIGVPWDTLFVEWSMMLWADGKLDGVPELEMSTWDLTDVMAGMGTVFGESRELFALQPEPVPYGEFTGGGTVRGGSTSYFLLSGSGNLPALAIRASRGAGLDLQDRAEPRFWILRWF